MEIYSWAALKAKSDISKAIYSVKALGNAS